MQPAQLREYLELVKDTGKWVLYRDLFTGKLLAEKAELQRIYQDAVIKVCAGIPLPMPRSHSIVMHRAPMVDVFYT